jgi:hypothetical protein
MSRKKNQPIGQLTNQLCVIVPIGQNHPAKPTHWWTGMLVSNGSALLIVQMTGWTSNGGKIISVAYPFDKLAVALLVNSLVGCTVA